MKFLIARKGFSLRRRLINSKPLRAFSLIELLIVVAIFGLTVSLVTAAFITFERNQQLRNAALQLQSDLRQTQNQALSGNKGSDLSVCPSTSTLGGWYVRLSTDSGGGANGRYTIGGDCISAALNESSFSSKTVILPVGISITNVGSVSNVDILYRPLAPGVSFHNASLVPPFFDSSGNLLNQVGAGSSLVITFTSNTGGTYHVTVSPSGEVNANEL